MASIILTYTSVIVCVCVCMCTHAHIHTCTNITGVKNIFIEIFSLDCKCTVSVFLTCHLLIFV